MRRDDEFIASLCPSFDLELNSFNFQLLWLIPIVEVMWADGRCQREEAEVLFHCVDRFVKLVGRDAPEITSERARRFFQPFLDASVGRNSRKRAELTRLSDYIIQELVAPAHRDKRTHLFDICVEVATSARADQPERAGRRISSEEERLLADLLRELGLDRT
jgi:hypothetical protein